MFLPAAVTVDYKPPRRGMLYTAAAAVFGSRGHQTWEVFFIMRKTDVLIIGAGPAGIFTALELLRKGSRKHIVIVEKGKPVEKRSCPKADRSDI